MARRLISSDTAGEDVDGLLDRVHDSVDGIDLSVDGEPTAMLIPLSERAQQGLLREAFGDF